MSYIDKLIDDIEGIKMAIEKAKEEFSLPKKSFTNLTLEIQDMEGELKILQNELEEEEERIALEDVKEDLKNGLAKA